MGEFERRIKECLPDYWRQTGGDNAIMWALNEACKEFPLVNLTYCDPAAELLILNWFKKWFGKVDEQENAVHD